jgi:hypothetical protein
MFQTNAVEKIKNRAFCIPYFSFLENHSLYEIMRKNIADPDRPQMTIQGMCISCRIPNATNTNSQYVILRPFPL